MDSAQQQQQQQQLAHAKFTASSPQHEAQMIRLALWLLQPALHGLMEEWKREVVVEYGHPLLRQVCCRASSVLAAVLAVCL